MVERLARLEQWTSSHEKICEERTLKIGQDTSEIKDALQRLADGSNDSRRRLHTKFDELATTVASNKAAAAANTAKLKDWILRAGIVALVSICVYGMTEGWPWQKQQTHEEKR